MFPPQEYLFWLHEENFKERYFATRRVAKNLNTPLGGTATIYSNEEKVIKFLQVITFLNINLQILIKFFDQGCENYVHLHAPVWPDIGR